MTIRKEFEGWYKNKLGVKPDETHAAWQAVRWTAEICAKTLEISADNIRLHAGEMTASEMRAVKAVLKWKASEIRQLARGLDEA